MENVYTVTKFYTVSILLSRKTNGFGWMFCCYSAAVAIPKLGLYALNVTSFSNYGMFTCLIVVNVWFYFCQQEVGWCLCCLQCRRFPFFCELSVFSSGSSRLPRIASPFWLGNSRRAYVKTWGGCEDWRRGRNNKCCSICPSPPLPSSSFSLSSTLFDTYRASPQASSEFEVQDGAGLI